jgi:uncharacterized protein YndB with AHSA1/START domain
MRVSEAFHVDAPPEFVYDIATDPERLPDWYVNITAVSEVSGPLDRPGTGYTGHFRFLGRRLEARVVVAETVRPSVHVMTATTSGGGRGHLATRFADNAGSTRVTVDVEVVLPAGFIGALVDLAFIEAALARDIRYSSATLKSLLELEYGTGRRR